MTDPATWDLCVAVLTAVGYKEPIARGLIGRQLREWDETDWRPEGEYSESAIGAKLRLIK